MSRLDELIKELCPDGVDKKPLGILADNCDSMRKPVTKGNRIAGIYPYYGASGIVDYVDGYLFDGDYLLISEDGANLLTRTTPIAFSVSGKNWVNNHAHVLKFDSEISRKYVEIYLNSINLEKYISTAAQPKLTKENLNKILIPIPPLEVQAEIVKILEAYSESVSSLQQELEKELTARKKQYEYYRDLLLDFDVHGGAISECEWRMLGDIGIVTKLAGFEFTNYVTYSDTGEVIALRGLNVKNGKLDLTDVKYIDKSDLSKLSRSKLIIDDMLFTYVGTIGQVALIDENDKYYLAPNVALIRINQEYLLPRFAMYFFQTKLFWSKQIDKLLQSSSMKNIPMEKIRKFMLPVPPIEEQERIVSILDRFDKFCNDISKELPAEIEARQKQYEYYRDKLLSFKEKKEA